MADPGTLFGRDQESDRLLDLMRQAVAGQGALALIAGEAGIGKTRLMAELAEVAGVPVLTGAATRETTTAYGPVVAALRAHLRVDPQSLENCGPLGKQLRVLLPELGDAPSDVEAPTLHEAIRCALITIARDEGVLLVLDDLQWSDAATLELLPALAAGLSESRVLVVGAYRSEELARDHPLRRTRNELRRAGSLSEIVLGPLGDEDAAKLLEQTLGAAPSAPLVRAIQDRSQGLPFFVEELGQALATDGGLQRGSSGLELVEGSDVVVPETIRDAVLLRCIDLTSEGRAASEVAAVAGERFALGSVAELADEAGVSELIEAGLIAEADDGAAEFRHALVREALYRDVPWLRRRSLHRALAEVLEPAGASSAEVATHWLGAHEHERARGHLVAAARDFAEVRAYRDATTTIRRALELWPEEEDVDGLLAALQCHGEWAELAGEPADAARSWRQASALHEAAGACSALAQAQRRLGRVNALMGDRSGAINALVAAADAFAKCDEPAEAASDRLSASDFLQFAGRHGPSLELSRRASEEARVAGRLDLQSRALAAEGVVLAKRGDFDAGIEMVKEGLSLALDHGLTNEAVDAYQRLGTCFETAGDYSKAQGALDSALDLCRISGVTGPEAGCVACMAYVLRELGEWPRAVEIARDLLGEHEGNGVRTIADGTLGFVRAFRGELGPARRHLTAGLQLARRLDVFSMQVDCAASLAVVADYDGDGDEAVERSRFILSRWEESEDHHYAIWGLRSAAALFAINGRLDEAHASADALTRIATESGHSDALAALAHALAEIALSEGAADVAAEQLGRAVELHRSLRIPTERMQILHRAGVALSAAGMRDLAIERHSEAYRLARQLGARPLAGRAAAAVEELGESVERRLGSAEDGGAGALSRRELQVIRLVAEGRTNREIAAELFLSPRTIDMHVRNILAKLDCRSRVEASIKAGEAGLLR